MKQLFFTLSVLMSGCAGFQEQPLLPLDPSELSGLSTDGNSVVQGQAFAKTRGGDIKYPAGNEVYLIPVVSHTQDWASRYMYHFPTVGKLDQRLRPYIKSTVTDAEGNFSFEDVALGDYFVMCGIQWEVPYYNQYGGGMRRTGGVLEARVSVKENRTYKVIVK